MANSSFSGSENMVQETFFCDFGHKEIQSRAVVQRNFAKGKMVKLN